MMSIFSRMSRVCRADPSHEISKIEGEQRGNDHHHDGQTPVSRQEQCGDGDRRAEVGQDRECLAGHEHLNCSDIVHHPRDDRAAGGLVVVRQAQLLEPLVEHVSQVANDSLADLANHQTIRPAKCRLPPNTPKSASA